MSEPIKRKASAAGIGREPALPVKPGMDKVASKLTRQARARLRRGNDMSLSMFLAVFNETGGDPAQAIDTALADKEAA